MDGPALKARYEELLRRYLAALGRLASSYADADADDLLQEIAMALWTALPRFRGDSSERTWVYRVAHNTAISFVTQRSRRRQREHQSDPHLEPAVLARAEGELIAAQRLGQLRAAIRDLPLVDRQIVVLHLEGLPAAEIAVVSGLSAGAVATRLTRIRQRLATAMREEGTS